MNCKNLKSKRPGIALFILMTSLMILAFAMKDLIQTTNVQVERVRNSLDRMQAIYLARSTLRLARFFIQFDSITDPNTDTLQDQWALPIPFPIPIQVLNSFLNQDSNGSDNSQQELDSHQKEQLKKCDDFFSDFSGDATAQIIDASSKINLNDTYNELVQKVLFSLLTPNYDFISSLEQRGIQPEEVVKEIRDFIDQDEEQNDTNAPETTPYLDAQLPYGPKNRRIFVLDEIKLVPSIDNQLYDYFSRFTTAINFKGRDQLGKINLNTVSKEVFQALLKDLSDPEETAKAFIKDREDNNRVYTDKDISQQLQSIGIDPQNVWLPLMTGKTDVFLVKTKAKVNDVQIELDSVVKRPNTVVRMRISP